MLKTQPSKTLVWNKVQDLESNKLLNSTTYPLPRPVISMIRIYYNLPPPICKVELEKLPLNGLKITKQELVSHQNIKF
jgi:hypothetical protein